MKIKIDFIRLLGLPSNALLQHLPSCLGFSYLGHRVSLHGCSSKAQLLLLTLYERYLLTAALPDLQRGMAPLGPPVPMQPPTLGLLLPATAPGLWHGVATLGIRPWPQSQNGSSWPPPWPWTGCNSCRPPPLTSDRGGCDRRTKHGREELTHVRGEG